MEPHPRKFKVKLLCSYGGKIQPRPHTNKLAYVGGDSKLLTVHRDVKLSDIVQKLVYLFRFETNDDVCMKYQLPGEDLDVLISLINNDDLENMMVEYDRLHTILSSLNKPVRMRLFLSSVKNTTNYKPTSAADDSGWDAPLNPDYLFGFDKDYDYNNNTDQIPGSPTNSAFDLELWKIPCTAGQKSKSNYNQKGNEVEKVIARAGHVTGGAATQPLVYCFPVMSVGTMNFRGRGAQGMVKMGMMNGNFVPVGMINENCPEQQPIYNFVPTMPSVPEQMKILVTEVDMSCHDAKVTSELR